ncbi:MAG: methyltransferase domain-containing protein [Hyalangium sp.]|uniref:methyltransferase domain-containing protein n=1 Tax=Hyalangium sp. TaxID=2028555 RepID=UPI00389AE8CB
MKQIAIGIAAPGFTAVAGPALRDARCVNFRIAPHRLSAVDMLDSVFASPGRYTAEMLRRLVRHERSIEGYIVVNPRFAPSLQAVTAAVQAAHAHRAGHDAVLVHDRHGRVAATWFRHGIEDADVPTLSALSALDPSADRALLEAAFGWKSAVVGCDADFGGVDANGFLLGSFDPVASAFPAVMAVEALGELVRAHGHTEARRRIRQVAVLPFHAGDILFLCQALQADPLASAIVVLRDYADIVREVAPWLEVFEVDAPAPGRDGYQPSNEQVLLMDMVQKARAQAARKGLRLEGVFHLMRPLRDYARTSFHLRQAAWFALGGDAEQEADIWPQWRAQPRQLRSTPGRRERVVVHFDGGWSLKSFPYAHRQPLVSLLRDAGFRVTVLGKPDPRLVGCDFEPFSNVGKFRKLLMDSAAVVGVDSFPAHYAVHQGVPTLHLFGSTHPRNSEYPASSLTATLHHIQPCVPCGHPTTCKLDQSDTCRAFSSPHDIVATLLRICPPPSQVTAPLVSAPEEELSAAVAHAQAHVHFPPPPRLLPPETRASLVRALRERLHTEPIDRCPLCANRERTALGSKHELPIAECTQCGLWYASERIHEADVPKLYDSSYWTQMMDAHGYPTAPERYAFDYAHALERVAFCRSYVPSGRALDVGCGYGAFVRRLAEYGYDAMGLDMPDTARMARRSSGIRVLTSLPAGSQFQLITGFDVIEHFYHPREQLQPLVAALAPGGALILETFRTDCADVQAQRLEHEDIKPMEHLHMFREAHVRQLIEAAGLRVETVHYPEGESRARFRLVARKS